MPRSADEDPDADLLLDADDPEGTGAEAADDPLAGLTDEQKAAVEERANTLAQSQIDQFKGTYGRRFGAAIQDARNKGLDIGEDGTVLIRDPQAAAQALGITVAQAERKMAEQTDTDPLDAPIDAYNDDPETVNKKFQRQVQREVAAALKPIQDELQLVRGTAFRPVLAAIPDMGREVLGAYGLEHIGEHPDFNETVTGMLSAMAKDNPGAYSDPDAIATAAMATVPLLMKTLPEDVRKRAAETRRGQDPEAQAATARRAALGRNGVSRHTPARSGTFTNEDIENAEALAEAFPESRARMTPAMARVLENMDTGGVTLDEWRAAQKKNGVRR